MDGPLGPALGHVADHGVDAHNAHDDQCIRQAARSHGNGRGRAEERHGERLELFGKYGPAGAGDGFGQDIGTESLKFFLLPTGGEACFTLAAEKVEHLAGMAQVPGLKDLLLPMDDLFSYAPPRWTLRAGACAASPRRCFLMGTGHRGASRAPRAPRPFPLCLRSASNSES